MRRGQVDRAATPLEIGLFDSGQEIGSCGFERHPIWDKFQAENRSKTKRSIPKVSETAEKEFEFGDPSSLPGVATPPPVLEIEDSGTAAAAILERPASNDADRLERQSEGPQSSSDLQILGAGPGLGQPAEPSTRFESGTDQHCQRTDAQPEYPADNSVALRMSAPGLELTSPNPTPESGCPESQAHVEPATAPERRSSLGTCSNAPHLQGFVKQRQELRDGEEGFGYYDGRLYRSVFQPQLNGLPSCSLKIGRAEILKRIFPGREFTTPQNRTNRRELRDILDELEKKCYIEVIHGTDPSHHEEDTYTIFSPEEALRRQRERGYTGWRQTGKRRRVLVSEISSECADKKS